MRLLAMFDCHFSDVAHTPFRAVTAWFSKCRYNAAGVGKAPSDQHVTVANKQSIYIVGGHLKQ